jgi:hypothetical protein
LGGGGAALCKVDDKVVFPAFPHNKKRLESLQRLPEDLPVAKHCVAGGAWEGIGTRNRTADDGVQVGRLDVATMTESASAHTKP